MEMLTDFGLDGLELVGPLLVAVVTVPLMGWLKRFVAKLDGAGALAKQVVVIVIAGLLTFVGQWLNVALPVDLLVFASDSAHLSAALSALLAFGIHNLRKRVTAY